MKMNKILVASEAVKDKVFMVIETSPKENLALGLLCEYAHNEALERAGIAFELTNTTNIYDRKINGVMHDDKLATLIDNRLARSHTISSGEYNAWCQEEDVIINSFEQISDFSFRYVASFSFKDLIRRGLILRSKKSDGYFFWRAEASAGEVSCGVG